MRHVRHLWLIATVVVIGLWFVWHSTSRIDSPSGGVETATQAIADQANARAAPTAAAKPVRSWQASRYPDFLPPEARPVLDAIARGGPHEFRQDGSVFYNREQRLPAQPRGYYREYTVAQPGASDRGPRRIITGGGSPGTSAPSEYWYSADHYRSFRRFDVDHGASR
jgi:guanyl-specific ribonuclease Sa